MKQCKYILEGHEFKSEDALDEYLLNNKDLYNKYGDVIFMGKSNQNYIRNILIESDKKKNALYTLSRQVTSNGFQEDYYKVEKPYIGVNEFLLNYKVTNENGSESPLFPVFDMDNYLANKKKDWQNLEYWENEENAQEKIDIFGDGEPKPLESAEDLKRVRDKLEPKWKHQSYVGTAVHNAMRIWWESDKSERKSPEIFEQYLRSKLRGEVGDSGKSYNELIPERIWSQLAQHCYNIAQELDRKFPKAIYLSEIGLNTEITYQDKPEKLVGIADLIIIDQKGNVQLIDYKTSPKSYSAYNDAKKRTFYYQLATYRRMLQRLGINLNENCGAYIIPLKFENFRYDSETDTSTFDNLYAENYNPTTGDSNFSYLVELPILVGDEADRIRQRLDEFIPIAKNVDTRYEDVVQELQDFTKECFTSYSADQEITEEVVIQRIKKQNNFKKDPTTNKYYIKIGKDIISRDTQEDLVKAAKKVFEDAQQVSAEYTQGFKRALLHSQETGELRFNFKSYQVNGKHASETWAEQRFGKYANKNWKILETAPILEELGVVLLQNKFSNQIDVIKLSSHKWQLLTDEVLLGGASSSDFKNNTRHLITGNFESDVQQKQRPKSQAMVSTFGNIELMQTMAILNMFPNMISNNNGIIGEVTVANIKYQQGIQAPPQQLLYNFKELQRLRNLKRKDNNQDQVADNFNNVNIKMVTYLQLISNQFKDIINGDSNNRLMQYSRWKEFKDCIPAWDNHTKNPIKLRAELMELANKIETTFNITKADLAHYSEYQNPERKLYYYIHMAIAEVDGVNYTQQVHDHASYMQNSDILKKGLSGSMIDNPGNMSSETLNFISEQLNVAYQNIRNDMVDLSQIVRNQVNKLKEAKKFGWIESRTIGNQTNLYKNMYEVVNGDLRFKNPWDRSNNLDDAEREFLMFAITLINKTRFGISEKSELDALMLNDPEAFFAVPLVEGTAASKVASRGYLETLKNKFKSYSPENIKNTILRKMEGYLDESSEINKARQGEMWEMLNMFSATEGNNNRRDQVIFSIISDNPDLGLDFFERNLETILLKHKFAYSQKTHIDKVFPTIKAGMLHLSMQGIIMNDKFVQDIDYLSKFIKNKIFNLSIQEGKWKTIEYAAGELMSVASKMALAFNPRQLYQTIDGIWKDISLYIRKPDGEESFTAKNLKDSFFWAYSDLIKNWGNNKSMCELVNEQYGLNDMDINTLTQRLSSDNVGIFNFWNIGFKFASRPDFYNRLTIFSAQMRGDGCFEAHSVKNNKLIYDWTKDKRFDLFAKTKESDVNILSKSDQEKYKKQKGLYIAMARQFMAEHALDLDGNEFILDLEKKIPLPRAYTTKQSEGMKALSDLIYGYYSSEKKSLVQSTTLGALYMQMNTYWSSKKNQWIAPGGIKMMGKMEQYEENGIKYWHKIGKDGEILDEPVPDGDPNASEVPYLQWKGQFQEGILVTVWNMLLDCTLGVKDYGISEGINVAKETWASRWNSEDESLKRAYRNNLKQLFYDLFMWLFMGMFVSSSLLAATKDYIKDVGNTDLQDAIANNAMLNTVEMLDSSFDDFNFVKSIAGRGVQWTPLAIQSMDRTVSSLVRMCTGSTDWYDTAVNFQAATRTQEPIWDYVKISTLGRKIGDNGQEE